MKRLIVFVLFSLMLVSAGTVYAYNVTVNFEDGVLQNTTALTGYGTTGAMMDGMTVTAYYLGGGYQTLTWAAVSSYSGAVSGSDWTLYQSGDTFTSDWSLSSYVNGLQIERIFFDAGLGNTVFDTTDIGDVYGTEGSYRGLNFYLTYCNNDALDIRATYSGAVGLDGAAPVGDLYRYLDISFNNDSGFSSGDWLKFRADTDNLLYAGDIQPSDPVPEPATIILLGAGLLGMAARRRRNSL